MIGRSVGVGVGVARKIGGSVWKMIGGAVGVGVAMMIGGGVAKMIGGAVGAGVGAANGRRGANREDGTLSDESSKI